MQFFCYYFHRKSIITLYRKNIYKGLTKVRTAFSSCSGENFSNLAIYMRHNSGGDYMIPVSRDEVLSGFAGIPAVL